MAAPRILTVWPLPDRLDNNRYLRGYVTDGFAAALGREQVGAVRLDTSAARVTEWRPALVLVCGSCLYDSCHFAPLRAACDAAGAVLAFWLFDDPYEFDAHGKILGVADHIFSNDRWASAHYHRPNVWHLPLAAPADSPLLPAALDDGAKERDVFFCGYGFPKRRQVLKDLAPILGRLRTEVLGTGWDGLKLPFCKPEQLAHERLAGYYAASRVVLNLGRDLSFANRHQLAPSTPGPRTFEAAAAAACQMIFVDSLEVTDYFRPEEEIILFNDPADFEDQLTGLLRDPERRTRIGLAARERCLRDHTYEARALTILERVGLGARRRPPEGGSQRP